MNIIIGQDKSVRMTQYSNQSTYNIEEINFYIAKTLQYEDINLKLQQQRSVYPFLLTQVDTNTNYNIYRVLFSYPVSLNAREYLFILCFDDIQSLEIGSISLNAIHYEIESTAFLMMRSSRNLTEDPSSDWTFGLTDEDEPVDIIDRNIIFSNKQNIVLAEDNISQCITFRLARFYEGIDFMTKDIYVDYVSLYDNKIYSRQITKDIIKTEFLNEIEYILIPWVLTYNITRQAGTLKFDISAIDNLETLTQDKYQYVWQTSPSSLTILPNLGKRAIFPVSPEDNSDSEKMLNAIKELQDLTANDVDIDSETGVIKINNEGDIEEVTVADLLASNSDTQEITFNAGGAPI